MGDAIIIGIWLQSFHSACCWREFTYRSRCILETISSSCGPLVFVFNDLKEKGGKTDVFLPEQWGEICLSEKIRNMELSRLVTCRDQENEIVFPTMSPERILRSASLKPFYRGVPKSERRTAPDGDAREPESRVGLGLGGNHRTWRSPEHDMNCVVNIE